VSSEPPIRDVAALTLCPESRANGIKMLDQILIIITTRIRRLDFCFKLALMCFIIMFGRAVLLLLLTDNTTKSQVIPWFLCISSMLGIGLDIVVWQKIQHSDFGRRIANFSEASVPEVLQNLIADYADDVTRTFSKAGTVPSSLFESHFAILLFSKEAEVRGWVRSKDGKSQSKEIYAVASRADERLVDVSPVQTTIEAIKPLPVAFVAPPYKGCDGSNEPNNLNENHDHQWLVGGSRREYEVSRNTALSAEPPRIRDWKAFVLDGGRYELRRGGQSRAVGMAVREIQTQLKETFGDDLSPNRKPSSALIKRMLSAGKANAQLRKHFAR
jgi:hypothetical protein